MERHWLLRDEYYRALHCWPILLACFALGSLLGWLAAYIWPAYYQATREVYVGLNPYRTYSDTRFLALAKPRYSNIDNYHYWQMNQLDQAIYLDDVLEQTLDELRNQNAYWQTLNGDQLRERLDTDWRTAGAWKLNAVDADRERARQLLRTWGEIAAKYVQDAVQASRRTLAIDQELQASAAELVDSELRQQKLSASRQALQEWIVAAAALPPDQPLDAPERWRLFALSASLAQDDPGWRSLMSEQPGRDAPRQAYALWVAQVLAQIDADQTGLQERIASLRQQRQALQAQYSAEMDRSLGLSPNLDVKNLGSVEVRLVRPATTLALIGGFVGMLVWIFAQLVLIARRRPDRG
jgi:hypothetical protein